jgi:hypothetical protein
MAGSLLVEGGFRCNGVGPRGVDSGRQLGRALHKELNIVSKFCNEVTAIVVSLHLDIVSRVRGISSGTRALEEGIRWSTHGRTDVMSRASKREPKSA